MSYRKNADSGGAMLLNHYKKLLIRVFQKDSVTHFYGGGKKEEEFEVVLTLDPEDGGYSVRCDALRANSQGETEQEAIDNIIDAIEACLDVQKGGAGLGLARHGETRHG